ncbi:antiviral reverse transcriptase Drt4 [Accumulibacter sp.]|uniref:antiviral reverse transcriptase Drt4 n=1 Tax=Accumulibacter sp. TaxID=2053492 RepID=UPI001AD4B032|nr:antiviral reverse transcriptase Drt4 [Accumulibacter sp.]MBN8454725.1 RNA-directed DNA polymerase [Accumulibacter sp.]MBO3707379.1 RNA-directed DNA polymerase [Candidatus Accumulibacter conexus]HRK67980.1 RNA-directed DNA polymerase [Hyphomonas sp.]
MNDLVSPAPHPTLEELFALELEWFYSTKEELSQSDVLIGLLDHGLFSEKVPPCFSTAGLAAIVSETMANLLEEEDDQKLRNKIDKCGHDYVRYEALRDINIPRHMGIPHPEAYAVQALAISKHWQAIATHCNQPDPAISRIYVRHVGNGCIFEMTYKGGERYRFEETEIQWMAGAKFVVEADIAACFPSIYTHCIPWALHSKSEAKSTSSITKLSGNLLDKCTQNTRDRQTNGLLIGPHASNIISEIILTRIDTALQGKGYQKVVRHVDDYRFFAETLDEAELFVKELGLNLRAYEMSLNEKKTRILELPRPSEENWILLLNRFLFPNDKELHFSVIRSFLDLALECAQSMGKSTPLNYAIKTIAGRDAPRKLNSRAKRMYAQEAMNLALAYPYLAPLLDEFVFDRYWHEGLKPRIADFATSLVKLGVRKLYPDTIAHALYFALKHDLTLNLKDEALIEVIALDDCVTNVLLLEYAKTRRRPKVKSAISKRAKNLIAEDSREKDKHWLLIFQVWSKKELEGNGQGFLAELKDKGFQFFSMLSQSATETAALEALEQPEAAKAL